MADNFDPYHKWLGIAPEEQPADHYRLLGVRTFESDPDVLENAADQRMSHVRNFQAGRRSDESQHLLNELASARLCLLNAEKRAAYDRGLRASQKPRHDPLDIPAEQVSIAVIPFDNTSVFASTDAKPTTRTPTTGRTQLMLGIAIAAMLLIVFCGVLAWGTFVPHGDPVIGTTAGAAQVPPRTDAANLDDPIKRPAEKQSKPRSIVPVKAPASPAPAPPSAKPASPKGSPRLPVPSVRSARPSPIRSPVSPPASDVVRPTGGSGYSFALRFTKEAGLELTNTAGVLLPGAAGTIEFWARLEPSHPYHEILGDRIQAGSHPDLRGNGNDREFAGWNGAVYVRDGDRRWTTSMAFTGGFNNSCEPSGHIWRHYAFVSDMSHLTMYVDGRRTVLAPIENWKQSPLNVFLGRRELSRFQSGFVGEVCAVKISSRSNYAGDFLPPERFEKDKHTVLLLDFSKGEGEMLPDLSGNNRSGKIHGATWVPIGMLD